MRLLRSPFVVGGLLVVLALGVFVSPFASSNPDGLEKVAVEKGFDETADDHALDDSPLADYGVRVVGDDRLSTAASGLVGVLLTFGVGVLLFGLVQRGGRRKPTDRTAEDVPAAA